ncbi:MBL fold metallo-hydrolase [Taibaiella sp. KBW10]|uniref:MBL fold metallo-hydrolase n=1 Tax=Taibaiella sp. KBW10 TaxID=2153357 RepID=UPI000F5B34CB|nr:MBL fold metallo-hydrolase [Taibaiella sp. KBW10]RQO29986.1 MBL fold metallo-hydrolase [Taibaiella sp. KBW10]
MQLHTINTGLFKLDGGAMHGVVPKALWNKLNPSDDNNMCSWAMRCLLVETDGRLILVDTGIGDKQDEKFFGHYYLHGNDRLIQSIQNAGYSPDDITDVFLTHLHFDHVGGAVKRAGEKLVPTFKNATYWSNANHWDWAINPNDREKASFLKENILPIQESGQLQFFEGKDGDTFASGFKVRLVNGHTESMMLPQLEYNNQTILYCADLLPSMHHLPMPWVMAYDTRPLETMKEKKLLLEEAVAQNWLLYFEHDAVNELCSLQQTDRGIRYKDILAVSQL